MGTIYQRTASGPFYGQWTDPTTGQHHKRSLLTRDRKVALERLRVYELVQTSPARHSTETLAPAIGKMLAAVRRDGHPEATISCHATHGKPLLDLLGDIPLKSLSYALLSDYVETRRKPNPITGRIVVNGTIQHELNTLRKTLKEAIKRQTWQGDLKALIPTIKNTYIPRDRWLTHEQAAALVAEVGACTRWYDRYETAWRSIWVATAIYTGGRASEVENLRVEHFRFDEGHVLLPGLKRRRAWRHIPLHPDYVKLIKPWLKGKAPGDRIVPSWGTNPGRDMGAAMRRINERRRASAGKKPVEMWPEHWSPNDLRRTFASWMIQAGAKMKEVADLMGHSSTAMVDRVYGHLSKENLRSAVLRLPSLNLKPITIRKAA